MSDKKFQNPFLLVIIFVVVGLIVGIGVGGYVGWKNKKNKERTEQPLQAQKTQEQKSKEQKNKRTKEQEIKSVEVKDWQTYENKEYKYKIKYPKNWFISKEEEPWLVNFTNYDSKGIEADVVPGVRVEILVQGNPKNLNLKDWVEEGHQYSGNPKLSREMKISDLDAVWEELDYIGPTINITIMRANDVFTISYTGETPEYTDYMKVFEKIVESLEVEG